MPSPCSWPYLLPVSGRCPKRRRRFLTVHPLGTLESFPIGPVLHAEALNRCPACRDAVCHTPPVRHLARVVLAANRSGCRLLSIRHFRCFFAHEAYHMSVFPLFSLTTHTPRAHFVSGFPPSRSLGRHRLPQLREDVPCRHVYLALRPPHFVDCLAQRPLLPLRRLEHPFEVIARHLDLPQHLPQFFGRVGRLTVSRPAATSERSEGSR